MLLVKAYNTFSHMNVSSSQSPTQRLAQFISVLGQPVRLQLLLSIGAGEVCVCHLEAHLGLRQAAVSQHLMVLRDTGLVMARREGRNIYYRLASPEILDLVCQAARVAGIPLDTGQLVPPQNARERPGLPSRPAAWAGGFPSPIS